MNRFRLLLLVAGGLAVVLIAGLALAFNSSFQTWATRKAIARQPALRATVGQISAGMKHVEVKDLQLEQNGAVLTLPAVEIDLPVFTAGFSQQIFVSRLVAKGWTLDLSKAAPTTSAAPNNTSPITNPPSGMTSPTATAAQAFAGVFAQLQLPLDISLDGVTLEGDVILPESRGRAKVTLTGGGLGAGRDGKFDLVVAAMLADPKVNSVELRGVLTATMDTPRSFTRLATKLEAAATGASIPSGVKLTADLAAARAAAGETYAITVVTQGAELLDLKADFPRNAPRLDGTWSINVRDADVAPFILGKPLPAFTAVGQGKFDADASFSAIHASGQLKATADRLQVLAPQLAPLGELNITADFDLAGRGGTLAVQKLEAAVNAAEPVATVRALQGFEFNPRTGELRATDANRELLGIVLQAVPVAWAQPFLTDIALSGGALRGELVATPRAGGVTLKSVSRLSVDGITVAQAGKPLVERLAVELTASADYSPQGWQAEISGFTAKSGDAILLSLEAKAGQLPGKNQPLKATGKFAADLPGWLTQPLAPRNLALTTGGLMAEFAASVGEKKEIQATIALSNLSASAGNGADAKQIKLPALSANLRADVTADGKINFNAPLVIQAGERKSDLALAGTIAPEKDQTHAIDAHVTSNQLVIDDVKLIAAVVPDEAAVKKSDDKSKPASAPPWAAVHGVVALQLKNVIYSDTFQVRDLTGRLRIDAGMLKLEGLQAGLGEGGRASVNGTVTFDAAVPQPYALSADVAVKEFDPGPLFHALNNGQPATLEGKFDVASKLASRASSLGNLALGAGGDFQLTSKGGIFRGLPLNVSNLVENTSKLATWIASAGTALSAMTGKKEYTDVANKAQAVAELAKGLSAIPYDQLSVVVSRDAALNTTLKNFTLIAPEIRLTGGGTMLHRPGSSLLEDSLAMEFKLRARGRQGELLKYLGALEAQTDDLGYAACTLPLRIGGTLGKPDTSELNSKLTSLALEKSGVTDKAAELFDKLMGRAK